MNQPKPFRIQVDDRERWSPVLALLQQSPQFHVTISRLKLGDYLIDNHLLFERKTLTDLIASVLQGRLFKQALRLTQSPLRSAIILEGTGRNLAGSGVSWDSIQGALIAVSLFCGIPLLRARTPEETVRTILFAARQGQAYASGALPRPGWRPRGKRARQMFILQGLPYIGPERAKRLLSRFGSVEAIVKAGPAELRSVHGIGKQVVEKLRWAVEEPLHSYRGSCWGFGAENSEIIGG